MTVGAPPLTDAEVLALKARYRAAMYRVAAVIGLAGLFSVFLVASLQAVFLRGPRPVFLWGAAAVEALVLVVCLGRRRLGLVAVCLLFIALQVWLVPHAGRLAEDGRARRAGSPR